MIVIEIKKGLPKFGIDNFGGVAACPDGCEMKKRQIQVKNRMTARTELRRSMGLLDPKIGRHSA